MTTPRVSGWAVLACGLLFAGQTACASTPGAAPPDADADLTSEDLRRNPDVPIEKQLMAAVPGVWITRTPDGGIAVRIRRTSTINNSSAPLYILDGMPFNAGPNGSLMGINPYDIESIKVLKDPVDTAMYGMRGANGVIIIRTRSPGG